MPPPPPVLLDELVEEVLLRIPPDEPACLVRASAVCKPWRRILAGRRFRRRFREFHGKPPILGLFHQGVRFVPTSVLLPAHSGLPDWVAMDCRHGRALFADIRKTFDLIVLDPVTGHQRRVPWPHDDWPRVGSCSAAVLCAAQGCNHHNCQDGHFLVAFVTTVKEVSFGWLYSSETGVWNNLTSFHHPNVKFTNDSGESSVLMGDALYFNGGRIMECQLGALRLSMFKKPIDHRNGILMTAEGGALGFAGVLDATNLTLWSREVGPEGAMGWTTLRVIDLKMLLPDGNLWIRSFTAREYIPTVGDAIYEFPCPLLSGFVEGTQVIFVTTSVGSYLVDLKAERARKVSGPGRQFFPYTSFHIPAMEAASTGQGQ